MSNLLEGAESWVHGPEALLVGVCCAALSIVISVTHIIYHLNNYTMPAIQIYVIRILVICPVYAVSSAIALWLGQRGIYAETFRDIYEAFVIYSFLGLILEFCGGETDCIYQIENEPPLRMPCPLCCIPPMPRDTRLMRLCQRGVLQFVIVKPTFAVLDIIALACGFYFVPAYQYFELTVYNISYTWALYCMFVFYMATNHIIRNFRPVLKFASVKIIVFATYYQSLAIKTVPMPTEDAVVWNDLILCVEMVLFAIMHCLAYPTSEFQGGTPDSTFMDNVKDVMKLSDVMQDMYHNFTPIYHDYGLQRSEKEMNGSAVQSSAATGMLSGNLDSVAVEMSNRYRGRNRRFAFNSLLRGDKPIRARLRPLTERSLHGAADSESEDGVGCGQTMDIESGCPSRASPSDCSSDPSDVNSSHGLLRSRSSKDQLSSIQDEDVRNPMTVRQSGDSDNPKISIKRTTAGPDNERYSDSPQSTTSEGMRRDDVVKMRTHGIGVIITASGGVTVRQSEEFPTEDEQLVNYHFLNPERATDRDSLTLDRTMEYRTPVPRYLNKAKTSNSKLAQLAAMSEQGSSAAPREEEGMQQEFEFGLSGLVDAEYLRQDDQPFKLDGEDNPDYAASLLKYKAAPLGAPVKLSSTFAKPKKGAPTDSKDRAFRSASKSKVALSASPNPFQMVESDLASTLVPDLLPRKPAQVGKTNGRVAILPPSMEGLGHLVDSGQGDSELASPPTWEVQPWETLPSHDEADENTFRSDSFEEFQGYDAHRSSTESVEHVTPDRKRNRALSSNSSHSAHTADHLIDKCSPDQEGSNKSSTAKINSLNGSSDSLGCTPPRKIVGKGRKKTDREQYDPEEDVDATY